MPRFRYYYEYDPEVDAWSILEEDGGYEHGDYYDAFLFDCATEDDARGAVQVLTDLASKRK